MNEEEKLRKQKLQRLRDRGLSYAKIGKLFNISRQRVHQILSENFDWTKTGRTRNREIIRKRDNYTCQICNKKWTKDKRRFDVHHIDEDKKKTKQYDNLEIESKNMITLCHKCHFSLHYK